MKIKLSILIPTIPERAEKFTKLYNRISTLAPKGVEILFDSTPKYDSLGGISVGEKRQKLIEMSKGKYFVFIDDDDNITDNFFSILLPQLKHNKEIICYRVKAFIDGKEHIIDQSIKNENEQLKEDITKRYPSVMNCYRKDVALRSKFSKLNNGEDFKWSMSLGIQNEIYLTDILQIYNYNSKDTVASSSTSYAIVTFSNNERYARQVEIQKESCKKYAPDIPYFHFTSFEEIGCKPHSEYPYAFKPYAIHKVREMGFNNILWLDSPVHFIKDSSNIFKHLKNNKIILFNNIGFSIASYTHDTCLNHFQMSRAEADKLPMVMACAMGFNFTDENIRNVFDTYLGYAHTNAYQGDWKDHRHDQSVISCIAAKKQIKLLKPHQTFIAYDGNPGHMPHAESVCLISKSL